jgi:hypothetical protein
MADDDRPGEPAYAPVWIALSIGCAVFLAASIAFMATYGIPGTSGGTSPNQQQSSGAPQPTTEMRGGDTLRTTGQGSSQPPTEDRK